MNFFFLFIELKKIILEYQLIKIRNRIVENNIKLAYAYANKVKSQSYKSLGITIEDLIQVCIVRLSRSVEKFDPSKGQLSTFAYRSMQNGILNYFRDLKRSKIEFTSIDSDCFEDIIDLIHLKNNSYTDYSGLYESINGLDKTTGIIFRLILQGYSQTEIAKELGLSYNAIRRLYNKGLTRLRAELTI